MITFVILCLTTANLCTLVLLDPVLLTESLLCTYLILVDSPDGPKLQFGERGDDDEPGFSDTVPTYALEILIVIDHAMYQR